MVDNEKWLPHPKYKQYLVSSSGRIKGFEGRLKKLVLDKTGYFTVGISHKGRAHTYKVHRLVLETHVSPRPDGLVCAHLNGNSQDNRLENLRWVTQAENCRHQVIHGTTTKGRTPATAKLKPDDVRMLRRLFSEPRPIGVRNGVQYWADKLGVTRGTIQYVLLGKTYRNVK